MFMTMMMTMILSAAGCAPVAGNYPLPSLRPVAVSALFRGEGFQLMAGSRLQLERAESELGQLKSQGFSRHDPQIIKSLARRKNIPVALLADRSGNAYYRFTAHLDPGVGLTLKPGALELTVRTRRGTMIIEDRGYLLEDRRMPGGCRPPQGSILVVGSPEMETRAAVNFLVRLPVRGEIVNLNLVLHRCGIVRQVPVLEEPLRKDPLP